MPSADDSTVLLCEWPVAVYVPADLPLDEASALLQAAESRLGVYAAELETFLQGLLPTVRVEVG